MDISDIGQTERRNIWNNLVKAFQIRNVELFTLVPEHDRDRIMEEFVELLAKDGILGDYQFTFMDVEPSNDED